MSDITMVTLGPWRIRTAVSEGSATVSYQVDGKSEVITSETHTDLALLRDAITEYLTAQEVAR